MARVTSTGIEPTTLAGYVERLQTGFRSALGQDLDVATESPAGQIIGVLGLVFAEQDEAVVAVGNGQSVYRSLGVQLDDLGSLLHIDRELADHSTVSVTLTGTSGTLVPAGSRARTSAGDVFATTANATIPAAGTVTASMRAVEAGPVAAAASALTVIVDLVAGWTAVTNAAAATLGRHTETDVLYRGRYRRHTARNARTSLDAILAAVLDVDGVTHAIIRENATGSAVTVQTIAIAARSFVVVVEGGTDAAVAQVIADTKPAGVAMTGATSVDVANGTHTVAILFERVTAVPLTITVDTTIGAGFPGNGAELIVQRVADWAAGEWSSGAGDFDTSGLGIGETLDTNRLLSPILSVPGHVIQTVTAVRKAGGGAIGTVKLNERLTIAAADVSVT